VLFTGVSGAQVENNTCNNAWDIWDATQAQFPSSDYPNTAISDCGNTYWLTTPVNGAAARSEQRRGMFMRSRGRSTRSVGDLTALTPARTCHLRATKKPPPAQPSA